uniref:Pectate lyase n=1 Tax=Leersia perrieri TaxID=77586 RepID=A0A0D9WLQ6_9ORYZ
MACSVVVVTWAPLCFFSILFFYLLATATATATHARNITADDEYWAARSHNLAAYVTDPITTLNKFNAAVLNTTTTSSPPATSSRRSLMMKRKFRGPCTSTNPIDRCWRCRNNWAKHRKRLAKCAMGFGHKTTGGLAGKIYTVTDATDDNLIIPRRGTLRYGVIQERPLWIVFSSSMVINLSKELIVAGDKTIDGRGVQVHITGAQITVQAVSNVIIHNVHVHDSMARSGGIIRDSKRHFGVRGESDGDGITVMDSSNVWIDHVSMWNCADGLIDVIDGSTAVTISNSHFTKHNHVMLFGARDDSPKDKIMQVTLAFNHFGKGLVQRMPRFRYGFFHIVNNDYTHWQMYAIGGNMNPTIISQGNRFRASDDVNLKEVTKREYTDYDEYKEWVWKSQDDLFLNGAFFNQSGGQNERQYDRLDLIQARHGHYAGRMTRFAAFAKIANTFERTSGAITKIMRKIMASSTSSLFSMNNDRDMTLLELLLQTRAFSLTDPVIGAESIITADINLMKTVDVPPAGDVCPVCLDGSGGDAAAPWKETACGHRFHARCVERWAKLKGSCPVCRQEMMSVVDLVERDFRILYGDDEFEILAEVREVLMYRLSPAARG